MHQSNKHRCLLRHLRVIITSKISSPTFKAFIEKQSEYLWLGSIHSIYPNSIPETACFYTGTHLLFSGWVYSALTLPLQEHKKGLLGGQTQWSQPSRADPIILALLFTPQQKCANNKGLNENQTKLPCCSSMWNVDPRKIKCASWIYICPLCTADSRGPAAGAKERDWSQLPKFILINPECITAAICTHLTHLQPCSSSGRFYIQLSKPCPPPSMLEFQLPHATSALILAKNLTCVLQVPSQGSSFNPETHKKLCCLSF